MKIALQIALMLFMAVYFCGAIGAKTQKERVTYFVAGVVLAIAIIVTVAIL